MSKARLIFALILSVALIGGATWFRAAGTHAEKAKLAVVNSQDALEPLSDEEIAADYMTPRATSSTITTQLSDTDLVGRQLFSDYMGLVADGHATKENLDTLAAKYSENILSLN